VVISYDFWRSRMAQRPDVLNGTVRIDPLGALRVD
jgi:hypothetical protein